MMPIYVLIIYLTYYLLKLLDSPDFMSDPFVSTSFLSFPPPQVCKEVILQLSADFFQLLEKSKRIALDSLIFMALLMLSGDLCICVI